MRRPLAMSLAASLILTLAACTSSPDATAPTSAAGPTTSTGSAPSPSASAFAAGTASPTASASATAPASTSAAPTASATPSPTAKGRRIPATVTGLHVAGVQDGAWPDGNVPFGALRLWDNGTAWSQIETTKGRYSWALLDRSVANAQKRGMSDILLVLGSTPTWNARRIVPGDYPVPGAASAPKDLRAWDAFVRAVATRYKGRITRYQVWNEASLAMFWDGTPELMAELTKRAHDIIKDVDPKATVVAASTTVRLGGAFNRFFPRYLAALADLGWPVDVFAAHLYPSSKGTTDDRAAFIAQVKDVLDDADAPNRPLWDTELNYGLAGPGPSNPRQSIEGAKARDWVVQTAFDSLAMGLSRTYWYIWTPKPYPLLGLQLTNDSAAVKGLRIVDQWIVGGTTTGCTDDGQVTTCPVVKNDVPSLIVWSDEGATTFTAPAGFTEACTTANQCSAVFGPIEVTETPIRLLP